MKVLGILAAVVTMIVTFGSRGAFAEPLKVGQAAPDFNLPDQNEKTTSSRIITASGWYCISTLRTIRRGAQASVQIL